MTLQERYPLSRRIEANGHSEEELRTLLTPYFGWTLSQLDAQSIDALLLAPDGKEVILLVGEAANAWLRWRGQQQPAE